MVRNSAIGSRQAEARLDRHERVGIVAPVVGEAEPDQPQLVHEGGHRHQLDRGDAELDQMVEHRRLGEAQIGAAQPFRHVRMQLRHTADMGLVEDRPLPGRAGPARIVGRGFRAHHAFGHQRRRVARVELEWARRIDQVRPDPFNPPGHDLGVGVQQQLRGVETVPQLRRPWAVGAQAIDLSSPQTREEALKDLIGDLRQRQPRRLLCGRLVEQAKLDPRGVGGEDRDVGALRAKRDAEWEREAGLRCMLHRSILPKHLPTASLQDQATANVAFFSSLSWFFWTLPIAFRGRLSAR